MHLGWILLFTFPTWGCDVPVFRYALERWPADRYEVTVFHREPLLPENRALIDSLEYSASTNIPYANYELHLVNLTTEPIESFPNRWPSESTSDSPWMLVRYPKSSALQGTVWEGPLTSSLAEILLDSPKRREVAAQGAWEERLKREGAQVGIAR